MCTKLILLFFYLLCNIIEIPSKLLLLVCHSRCSVFLLDRLSHELVAKVFDGGVVSDEEVQIHSLAHF